MFSLDAPALSVWVSFSSAVCRSVQMSQISESGGTTVILLLILLCKNISYVFQVKVLPSKMSRLIV